MSAPQFTPGPWKVVIDGTLTGAWAEVAQECLDPETNEPWDRELFRSETIHIRKADCYPPNGTFGDVNTAPNEWELTEDGEEHLANARLIAAAPRMFAALEGCILALDPCPQRDEAKAAIAAARGEQ